MEDNSWPPDAQQELTNTAKRCDSLDDSQTSIPSEHSRQVFQAYQDLTYRRVDLVGDYAGKELFLIEGDSLLLQCFNDERLDFDTNLQLLHAVYNVERLLSNLTQRKCMFKLIFFDGNKELCIPETACGAQQDKYLLARAVIIRHLQVHLTESHPQVEVKIFTSWSSSGFTQLLQKTPPYFLMAHDGAQAVRHGRRHMRQRKSHLGESPQCIGLRSMILFFAAHGFNVALVNELEFRDTKVMTTVLDARHCDQRFKTSFQEGPMPHIMQRVDVTPELHKLQDQTAKFSERQLLAIITIGKLLHRRHPSLRQAAWAQLCSDFLLHEALLHHAPLSSRRLKATQTSEPLQHYFSSLASTSAAILNSSSWSDLLAATAPECDIADFVDGRMLLQVYHHKMHPSQETLALFRRMLSAVEVLIGPNAFADVNHAIPIIDLKEDCINLENLASGETSLTILPFSSPVFDKHLESVRIETDVSMVSQQSCASIKIFKEVSHWHNAKKALVQKIRTAQPLDWRATRMNQRFMSEMQKYAASLTNAIGKSLEPEIIIAGSLLPANTALTAVANPESETADSSALRQHNKGGQAAKKGGGGKVAKQNKAKLDVRAQAAAAIAAKKENDDRKVVSAWQKKCSDIQASSDYLVQYRMAHLYFMSLAPATKAVVGADCELYMVCCLVHHWKDICRVQKQLHHFHVPALIWYHLQNISLQPGLTRSIVDAVQSTKDVLGLPPISQRAASSEDRKLPFTLSLPLKSANLSVALAPKDFQLMHCGPYLERSFNSQPDHRVDFQPDDWQIRVLNAIDADQSVFVVAPTSAGKTFISFYAMRKVLKADNDGVLVYVAPTKALVNQIAAEIQARFTKTFDRGGKSVWAIHTRDYRINNPNGCQILVTVPHILQIMLLSPSNAKSWSNRIRRIIFDEIHSIGQAEDGVIWEQLLLMAPCSVICLSATVGNPAEFSDWLASTQKATGSELITVQHHHRYSDLRKYYHVPPKRFFFNGLRAKPVMGSLDLDGLTGFNYIHPVAALVDKSRGIPADLALEPRDCLILWQAMLKVQNDDYLVPKCLNPASALPDALRKVHILEWEKDLKELLKTWLEDPVSPYDRLLQELERSFRNQSREAQYFTCQGQADIVSEEISDTDDFLASSLPLLCRLHERDALPAIIFNYDRINCEETCKAIMQRLQTAELSQQKSGPKWQRKLERWEKWKEAQAKAVSKKEKLAKSKMIAGKNKEGTQDQFTKLDLQREAASGGNDERDLFDPEAPVDGYHFANYSELQSSELDEYTRELRWRDIPEWLINALRRGIGVHHAGMNRKYRQVVEMLFRKRFLRVVIATGTLALGINMPCKTVVFAGDSVYLTALNYRQCAGRSGRRGFDLLGNVVFQGISRQKVCRLISSRLPDLIGHFPLTTSLVLRLFILLHESGSSQFAVDVINPILGQPRLYMGGDSFKQQTMHHLRFSIEYLRRQYLLGSDGAPLNFAGLVSHLYYTENSSFAFHALLKEGYFSDLCAGITRDEKGTLETLMLVMSHLFGRIFCRRADAEFREKVVKHSSSMVFLSPLPGQAAQILREHNNQTLNIYKAYAKTFVNQHITKPDCILPLTGTKFGGTYANAVSNIPVLPPTTIRSCFVALSGAGDDFDSIHDLCTTTRSGVFLEEAVIPYMQVYPDEMDVPLNAWLLDFYKHGDVVTIEKDNMIRRSDIWFLLNDFSLVLATIVTSLTNFLSGSEVDMSDVKGGMDVFEEERDEGAAVKEDRVNGSDEKYGMGVAMHTVSNLGQAKKAKKPVVKASWDDDEGSDNSAEHVANDAGVSSALDAEDWVDDGSARYIEDGAGLRHVLRAFQKLQTDFNKKFRAMWA